MEKNDFVSVSHLVLVLHFDIFCAGFYYCAFVIFITSVEMNALPFIGFSFWFPKSIFTFFFISFFFYISSCIPSGIKQSINFDSFQPFKFAPVLLREKGGKSKGCWP